LPSGQGRSFDEEVNMTVVPSLYFSSFFGLAGACIYGYVGWRLSKRVVISPEARLAWRLFTIWWFGLAATTLIGGLLNLSGALGLTNLPFFAAATYINILVICIALWGLLYYLFYIFTGNSRSLVPLAAFYIIYYAFLVYYVTASIPNTVSVGRWSATLAYQAPLTGFFFVLLVALLLLPQIVAGLAYFSLYFRLHEATQKFRILLVSWSIIIWFLSPLIALAGGVAQQDWWQLTSRCIGLAAAITILIAYLPPRWVQKRFGILSLNEENTV
jgi:hypothetical protein